MSPVLRLTGVGFDRDGRTILDDVNWQIDRGQRWVVIGSNGSGKTTLIRMAALYEHPSRGVVEVLGQRLGRCDVRSLRTRIAFVSAAFADLLRPDLTALDVVVCAIHASLEPWWHQYTDDERAAARRRLESLGIGDFAMRSFGSLSSGERQRVLLARALMTDPELLLLDEPAAGLDLGGREQLLADLDRVGPTGPAMVLVTHHVEEIPTSFTHIALMTSGRVSAQGTLRETLTSGAFSRCVGVEVEVERRGNRWTAYSRAT